MLVLHAEQFIDSSAFVPIVFFQCFLCTGLVESHVLQAFYHYVVINLLGICFGPEPRRLFKLLSIPQVHFCDFGILGVTGLR